MKILSYFLLVFFLASCATPGQVRQESIDRYNNLTKDFITDCTSVYGLNDRLESFLTFSTKNCYQEQGGILRFVWNDQFLRAYVSKTTNEVELIQVYSVIYHRKGTWAFPYSASYLINDVLQNKDGIEIATDVSCSSVSCTYREDFGFDVGSEIFDEARRLQENGIRDFQYRINTRVGDVDRIFNVVEILGLEEKIKQSIIQESLK